MRDPPADGRAVGAGMRDPPADGAPPATARSASAPSSVIELFRFVAPLFFFLVVMTAGNAKLAPNDQTKGLTRCRQRQATQCLSGRAPTRAARCPLRSSTCRGQLSAKTRIVH